MGYTLAIVGCGVMGQAFLSALYKAPKAEKDKADLYPELIITSNTSEESAERIGEFVKSLGESPNGIKVETCVKRNREAADRAQVIVLGVKPYAVETVLTDMGDIRRKLLISLAAGVTLAQLGEYSSLSSRVMTNTPAKYGYGTAVVSFPEGVPARERETVLELVNQLGKCVELPEKNMDAATALVGSGPAFVLLMMESMMEAGLKMGIPLQQSRECTIKVLEGTAKMLEQSGESPGALKHQVCTPGGTTIAGLCVMEDKGVKSGIIRGIEEAQKVAAQMGQKK